MFDKDTRNIFIYENISDFISYKVQEDEENIYFITRTGEKIDKNFFNRINSIKFRNTFEITDFVLLNQIWELIKNTLYEKNMIIYSCIQDIDCFSLTTYFPKRFGELNQEFVYNFKEGVNTEYYANIFSEVINDLFCNDREVIKTITILPIPASKKSLHQKRYKKLFELISEKTGIINGYNAVEVLNDIEAKHLHPEFHFSEEHLRFNTQFFQEPIRILVIDDVITRGNTLENFINKLIDSFVPKKSLKDIFIKGLMLSKTIPLESGNYIIEAIENKEEIYFYPKKNILSLDYKIDIDNKIFTLGKGFKNVDHSTFPEDAFYQEGILRYSIVNDIKYFYFSKYYSQRFYDESLDRSFFYNLKEGKNTEFYANIISEALIKLFGKYKLKDGSSLLENMTLVFFNRKNEIEIKDGYQLFELISKKTGILNGIDIVNKTVGVKVPEVQLDKIKRPHRIVIFDLISVSESATRNFLSLFNITNILPANISLEDPFIVCLNLTLSKYFENLNHEEIIEENFCVFK